MVIKARLVEKMASDYRRPQPQEVQRPQYLGKRPAYSSPSYERGYGQSSGSADKR